MPAPDPPTVAIPDPAVVVLVGASGSGKTHWASERYRSQEIVSSDGLRAVVGAGPHDLDASVDAFALLDQIITARTRRRLTTVVDSLGLDPRRRRTYLAQARASGLPAVVVLVQTPAAVCRARNSQRDIPVPAPALSAQLSRMRAVGQEVREEGWDLVVDSETQGVPEADHARGLRAAERTQRSSPRRLEVVLQLSRFPWNADPAGWLREVVVAAEECGYAGVALMDHLIQIPQVGRAWDDLPEPYVTLGMLAALSDRLRLGTLVTPVTFRAAGIVAKAMATLDALSGGRAFLGIGAGWWEREHAAYGLAFPSPRERLDLLEQALQTVTALWAPGTTAYRGTRVSLPETTCYPRPVTRIPVIVGGGGEQRTLRLAAQYADGCNLTSDEATLTRKLAALRRHCAAVGRDPDEVAVTVLDLPLVGQDREHVGSLVERLRGRTPAATYAARHHAGVALEHVGRYRRLADLGVRTVFVAPVDLTGPAEVRRLRPVVEAFAG